MGEIAEHTVLVVNDSVDALELMHILLNRAGYNVLTAEGGHDAYELAHHEKPDLIISDVSMPEGDGIELCYSIRSDEEINNTPILLVSAHRRDSASVIEGLQAGADDYLEVPFEPERLKAKAARLIERKDVEEELKRSKEWLTAMFEASSDGIVVEEGEGIVFVNKRFAAMYGYDDPSEIIGLPITHFQLSEDAQKMLEYGRMRSRGEPAPSFYEFKAVNRTGIEMDIEATISTFTSGGKFYIVTALKDITERKQAEKALSESEERLRLAQKMEAIGRLAGGIAHDFNNLLTAISGYSDLILAQTELDESVQWKVEEIKKAGERAALLTRQLLSFSRKEALKPIVLRLDEVVADMSKMLLRLIGEDIELVTSADESLGSVKADPGQIQQVIMNLAVNARDAMPRGGKLTIEVRNTVLSDEYAEKNFDVTPGDYVMLSVSDSGVGMDRETRERVFEPFFTTKEMGKGTGLGLSTVYGIIKQSGGYIWVYSEPGQGTTFKIYLPCVEEEGNVKGAQLRGTLPRGAETVLLVEDEDMVRNLARMVLESCGYNVLIASNGNEAIKIFQKHRDDIKLLLTDVVMPRMSGRELYERIRKTATDIAVIYMSGYTDDAVISHGVLESGINYLSKPFTPESLAYKVREVLDSSF